MNKVGILLINLGTPNRCDYKSVYRFLTEFLNDPRVIDLAKLPRWLLVNFIIVPLRYRKSTRAYQKIASDKKALPLLAHAHQLQHDLAIQLGNDYQIEVAMRYGHPSIPSALEKLQHCERLIAVPLFPQYASASTGSAMEKLLLTLAAQWTIPDIRITRDFYNDPGFIAAYADIIRHTIGDKKPDLILFSYHGLPERHLHKSGCQAKCDRLHSCPQIADNNRDCYRAQCYTTSRLLATALNLAPNQYQTAFQSRLGRTPWIKPYTDVLLTQLRQQGIKRIAVVCPSFVADCLETLEEVNIRAREQWLQSGGSEFIFIPCLNNHPLWIKALAEKIQKL